VSRRRARIGVEHGRVRIGIYLRIARMGPRVAFVYRFSLAVELVSMLLEVFLLKTVWTALYAGHQSIDGLSRHDLVTYLTLTNMQLWLMYPFIAGVVRRRVRDGSVAHDLARPVGFPGQMLAQQLGTTIGIAPLVAIAFPLAALLGGLQLPASLGAAFIYAISLALAYLVTILLGLLLGLVAFWTLELGGFIGIYFFVSQFFSGALVPLRFFPPALKAVAEVLPFQTQAALPISIYLGQEQGTTLLRDLALQCFWALALVGAAWLVWRGAVRRMVIQGG
jgi:ABC-2 type transport system permease protein